MALIRLIMNSPLTAVGWQSQVDLNPGKIPAIENYNNYIGGVLGGLQSCSFAFAVGAIQATGTLTSTGTATAAQACTILNQTFTARASGAVENEFNVSATPATQAANIAAAINASSALTGKCTAVAVDGVVTITSTVPGLMGNGLQLSAGNLSNVTAGAFAGGLDGTSSTISML